MALIDCTDCGNRVSDSAAACPRCGKPVACSGDASLLHCPFCRSTVSEYAKVCPGCHAEKGYTQASGVIYGVVGTVLCGISIPGLIALWLFSFGNEVALIVGMLFLAPVLLSVFRLATGPVWYRRQ